MQFKPLENLRDLHQTTTVDVNLPTETSAHISLPKNQRFRSSIKERLEKTNHVSVEWKIPNATKNYYWLSITGTHEAIVKTRNEIAQIMIRCKTTTYHGQ